MSRLICVAMMLILSPASLFATEKKFSLVTIDRKVEAIKIADKTDSASTQPGEPIRVNVIPPKMFDPPLIDVLARRIAAERIAGIDKQVVELLHAETSYASFRPKNAPSPGVVVMGNNVGTSVAGTIVGNAVIVGIDALVAKGKSITVITVMDVKVGDTVLSTSGASTGSARSLQATIAEAIDSAIEKLVERLMPIPEGAK